MPISSNVINWKTLNSTDIVPEDRLIRLDLSWSFTRTASTSDVKRFLSDPSTAFDVQDVFINVGGGGGFVTVKRRPQYKNLSVEGLRLQVTMLMLNESDAQIFGLKDFSVTGVYSEDGTKASLPSVIGDAAKKLTTLTTLLIVAVILIAIVFLIGDVKSFVPKEV